MIISMVCSMKEYDLYSPFDVEKHKQKYINYLEVIIRPDGVVEYAVPSHIQKLESLLCDKLHLSLSEMRKLCPPEMYCDYNTWLCNETGCILMWDYTCIGPEVVTPEQIATIKLLEDNDLYKPYTKYDIQSKEYSCEER